MSQPQTTPTMKRSTSKNLLGEEIAKNKKSSKVSREMLNEFYDAIQDAELAGIPDDDDMPWVEAPREIIEQYNRNSMKGFEEGPLYFVFQGVKVYEAGRREEAIKRNSLTLEKKLFPRA